MTDPDKKPTFAEMLAASGVQIVTDKDLAKEAFIIVGLPDDGTEYKLVPGTTNTQQCCKCGIPVWLAPSGQQNVTMHPGNTVQCLTCVRKLTQQ